MRGNVNATFCAMAVCCVFAETPVFAVPVTTIPDPPSIAYPFAYLPPQAPIIGLAKILNNTDVNVSNLAGNESEVSIDVNPTNSDNLVIVGHSPDFSTMNTFYTMDGGETWTRVSLGDAEDGQTSTFRFDPSIAFDDAGNVFVAYGVTVADGMGTATRLLIARSTDGGQSYTHFANAGTAPDGPTGTTLPGSDKWQLGTGPDQDDPNQINVYLALTANLDDPGGLDQRIVVIPSFDGGDTFITSIIVNDDSLGSSNSTGNLFAEPAVGPNGEIYVVWHDTDTGQIKFDEGELVGGITFGTDVVITTISSAFSSSGRIGFKVPIPAQPNRGVFAGPVIDVDRSSGPNSGRLYLVYVDVLTSLPDTDIFVRHSDDQGATWSAPVIVNDDTGTNSQFLPWLDVDQTSGVVTVVWYDARNDPSNEQVEVFMTVSEDGGLTFEPNVTVSDAASDQSASNPSSTPNNYLEYIGIASHDSRAHMVWADNSANLANLDYYTDRVSIDEVLNDPPVANAGGDQNAIVGNLVTLDGSGSFDPDNGPSPLTYSWTQTGGAAVALQGAATAMPTFTPNDAGAYVFELVVNDGYIDSAPDPVEITVSEPPPVSVPDVVGLTQANAEAAIIGAGLVVGTVTQANSDTVPAGQVISQNPAAGAQVPPGSAVDFVVSLGPAPVAVPNVVGLTQANAEAAIVGAGLVVGTVTQANSDTVPAGQVISQNPAAGAQVPPGSAVDFVVSLGPAPVAVPNVVGLTQANAEAAITGAGLVVGTVTQANSNTVPAGQVISQNPVAGSQVPPGSAVDFVVSLGPAPVAVPNVVGLTQANAEAAITGAGLVVGTVTQANSDTVPAGQVISQNPVAGTQVALGSAVDFVVSLGPAGLIVPALAGLSQDDAEAAIVAAGFTAGEIMHATSAEVPAGHILDQSPAAGTNATPGSPIDLTVSIGAVGATGSVADPGVETSVSFDSPGHEFNGSTIVIPANSLAEPTSIFFVPGAAPEGPPEDGHIALVFTCGPSGLIFDPPARITVPWPHVPGDISSVISVAIRDPETGELDETGIADVTYENGFISFTTTHFSDFVVVTVAGDVNVDGVVDAVDVQLTINAALSIDIGVIDADINNDGAVDAVDVQLTILAALGR